MVIELGSLVGVTTGVVQFSASARRAFIAAFQRHVGLGADNGFDSVLVAAFVEVKDTVHVAVIGDPQSWLAVIYCCGNGIWYSCCSIEH